MESWNCAGEEASTEKERQEILISLNAQSHVSSHKLKERKRQQERRKLGGVWREVGASEK